MEFEGTIRSGKEDIFIKNNFGLKEC